MPKSLTATLLRLKSEQTRYRLKVGSFWQGNNWIFTQTNGKMMCYSTPYSALQDILTHYNADKAEAGKLPMIPFHGLRHTSAALLIAGHEDAKTVSARLGHAETSTTLNTTAYWKQTRPPPQPSKT